ncbi:hypothetical protein ACFL6Y_11900 [Elusimicrobiota bacterium]
MPGFRRRRKYSKPNKNEEKVRRGIKQERMMHSAGTIAQRFPSVLQLSLEFSLSDNRGMVLDSQKKVFTPKSACRFKFPCSGHCGRGQFDFSELLSDMVYARRETVEDTKQCQEPIYGANTMCGCPMKYTIKISFAPIKKEEPQEQDDAVEAAQ